MCYITSELNLTNLLSMNIEENSALVISGYKRKKIRCYFGVIQITTLP